MFDLLESDAPRAENVTNINFNYYLDVAGKSVLFQCFNTAWMVRRDINQEGNLLFPMNAILKPKKSDYDLVVSVFHHPYNWMQNENARAFRKLIHETSDVALTGHEHEVERTSVVTGHNERIQYFEGGVLQNSYNDEQSTFNAITIDFGRETPMQKATHFAWDVDYYNIAPDSDRDFSSLQLNLLRQQETLIPNPIYLEKLNDVGANFIHRLKGKLKLTDTYINLSLRELHLDINEPEAKPIKIKANDLVNELTKSQYIFITGSDKSGKSSIAKRLYTDLLPRGYIPLAVDGGDMRAKTRTQVNQSIEAEHRKQYSAESYNRYKQVDEFRKVLIIDDFHLVNLNTDTRIKALKQIGEIYGHIVILLSSHTPFLDEVDLTSSEIDYKYYSIDPLNHSLREDAIQRWILMDDDGSIDKISMLKRIDAARTVVDAVIGNHYVPSYPFFVLSVLQVFHEGASIDSQSTSLGMGYFYEKLIRSALTKALENMEISGALAYLSYVANTFWEKGQKKVVNKEFREIHRQYCEAFDISEEDFAYETTIKLFVEAGMLEQSSGEVKFKYDQNYYYFVALYLSERLNKEVIQQRIQNICDKLSVQENADTMLFLAHLSKNSMIVDFLLLAARKVFPLTIPTDLNKDIGFLKDISDVAKEIPKLYAERREPEEVRKHNARDKDYKDEQNGNEPTAKENSDSPAILEQRVAFNLMQIMGQLLKNYPYALEKDVKRDLVEQSCLLGFRALKDVFDDVEEALTYIMTNYIDKSIYKVDEASNHIIALQKLEADFKRYAFVLAEVITRSYTTTISDMIFVKDLSETYRATSQKNNSTAFDLVHAALLLKQNLTEMQWNHLFTLYERLSKSNLLVATVLRYMVYQNLMLFPPSRDTFQKVCDKLSISRHQQIKLKQESTLL